MTQEEAIEKAEEAGAIVSGGLKLEDITDEPLKFSTSYKAGGVTMWDVIHSVLRLWKAINTKSK